MKSKLLSRFGPAGLALGLLVFHPPPAKPQNPQQVIDEVIAQVNDDIITLSRLKTESRRRIDILVKMGRTEQEATAEVTKHRNELISSLINDLLLVQKGKELELSEQVEEEVNQRLTEIVSRQPKPPDKAQLEEMRGTLRTEIMKQAVFEKEVDSQIFFEPSLAELRRYFDTHKDKFRKPETVTLSEIFLSSAGKNEAQVKLKAEQLVAQLRAGAIFARVAAANSEREHDGKRLALTTGGKVGTFEVSALRDEIATAIRNTKAGTISEPIKIDDGYQILRVDERTAASTVPVFNQNRVREELTIELSAAAHREYLQRLRADAYIEIAANYQGGVATPR